MSLNLRRSPDTFCQNVKYFLLICFLLLKDFDNHFFFAKLFIESKKSLIDFLRTEKSLDGSPRTTHSDIFREIVVRIVDACLAHRKLIVIVLAYLLECICLVALLLRKLVKLQFFYLIHQINNDLIQKIVI